MARHIERSGVVESFDEHAGLGVVEGTADGQRLAFHCTALVDGSRYVVAGQRVRYGIGPSHAGRIEAVSMVKIDD